MKLKHFQTPQGFRDDMAAILGHVINLNGQDVAANAHDAMWAIALGLNASIADLAPRTLEEYSYGDEEMADVFKANIEQVHFDGVSVRIIFIFSTTVNDFDMHFPPLFCQVHCQVHYHFDIFQSIIRMMQSL